ncbi:MAG: hypothetical protein ACH37Z_15475 [Anaerolineae bacterium]|nr:hypothetical protein [Ardenticatenia bacterium]HQZ69890.1 hypothetical protein [Anaerolineae bacterium]
MSFKQRALCPCGSGLRGRDCCDGRARARRLGLTVLVGGGPIAAGSPRVGWPATRRAASSPNLHAWELDLLHLGVDSGAPRALRLVMAGSAVLHVREIPRPLGPIALLAALEGAVLAAADEVGAFPEEIRLRDAELAEMLTERLRRWRVRCRTDLGLYAIDGLGADLRRLLDPRAAAAPAPPG